SGAGASGSGVRGLKAPPATGLKAPAHRSEATPTREGLGSPTQIAYSQHHETQPARGRKMASKRKRSGRLPLNASVIANLARSNPYVQRLIDDPKLRKQISAAVSSGRSAYGRVSNGKVHARGLLEDRK